MSKVELNAEQNQQCDFVDNTIQEMLRTLISEKIAWDQKVLADIREVIVRHYHLDMMQFYPYLQD